MARPMPIPSGLVVKKGSKILAISSSPMPFPRSRTKTSMVCSSHRRVPMLSTRCSSGTPYIDSKPLRARFTTTCSIWIGSAVTGAMWRQLTDDFGANLLQFQAVDRNRLADQIVQRNGGNVRAGFLHEVADPAEDFRGPVGLVRNVFQGRQDFAVMFRTLEHAANAPPGVILGSVQRLVQFVGQAGRHLAHDAQTRHVGQLDLVQLQLLLAGPQVAFDLLPPGDVAIQPMDKIGQVAADDAEKSQGQLVSKFADLKRSSRLGKKEGCNCCSQHDVQNRGAQSAIPGCQNDRGEVEGENGVVRQERIEHHRTSVTSAVIAIATAWRSKAGRRKMAEVPWERSFSSTLDVAAVTACVTRREVSSNVHGKQRCELGSKRPAGNDKPLPCQWQPFSRAACAGHLYSNIRGVIAKPEAKAIMPQAAVGNWD